MKIIILCKQWFEILSNELIVPNHATITRGWILRSETQLPEMQSHLRFEQSVVMNLANACIFLDHISVVLCSHRNAKFFVILLVVKKFPL